MSAKSPADATTAAGSPPALDIVDLDDNLSSTDEPDRAMEEHPARVVRPESTGFCLVPPIVAGDDGTDLESIESSDEAIAAAAGLEVSRGSVALPEVTPVIIQLRETAGGGESVTMLPAEGTLRKLSMAAAPPGVTDEEICEGSEEEEEAKMSMPASKQELKTPMEEVDTMTVVAGKQQDRLHAPVPELAITTDEEEVSPEAILTSPLAEKTSVGTGTAATGADAGKTAIKSSRRRRGPRRRRQKDRGQVTPQQMTFIVPGGDAESDDGQPAAAPSPRRRLEPIRRERQTPSPGRSPELTAARRRLYRWPERNHGLEELCGLPTDEEFLSGGEDPAVGRLGAGRDTFPTAVSIDIAAAPFFARLEDLTGRVSSLQTCRDPDEELRELVEAARRESVTLQAAQKPPHTDGTDIESDSTGSEEWDLGTALRRLSVEPSPNLGVDKGETTGASDISDEEGWSLHQALRRLSVDASLLPSPRRNMVRISVAGTSEEPLPEELQPKDELSTGEDTEGEDVEADGFLEVADMPRRPSTPGVYPALSLLESTLVVMEDGEKIRRRGVADFKSFSIDVPEPAPLKEGETFVALPDRKKRRQKLEGLDLASLLTDTEEVALGEVLRRRRSSAMVEYLLDLTDPTARVPREGQNQLRQQLKTDGGAHQESGRQDQVRMRQEREAASGVRSPPAGRSQEAEVSQSVGRRRQGGEPRPAISGRKAIRGGKKMQNGTK